MWSHSSPMCFKKCGNEKNYTNPSKIGWLMKLRREIRVCTGIMQSIIKRGEEEKSNAEKMSVIFFLAFFLSISPFLTFQPGLVAQKKVKKNEILLLGLLLSLFLFSLARKVTEIQTSINQTNKKINSKKNLLCSLVFLLGLAILPNISRTFSCDHQFRIEFAGWLDLFSHSLYPLVVKRELD